MLFACIIFMSTLTVAQRPLPPGVNPNNPNIPQNGPPLNDHVFAKQEDVDKRRQFTILADVFFGLLLGLLTLILLYMVWVNAKWYKEKEAWFEQKQPELRASAKKIQNAQGAHVRLNSVSSAFSASVFGISNSTPLSLSFKHVSFWVQDNRHELSMYDRYVKKLEPKELQILRDIQGYFEAGKLTAVMGPSGCGKTTLLTLLAGRTQVGTYEGTFAVNGRMWTEVEPYRDFMAHQGFVEQFPSFFDTFTVKDELTYACMLALPDSIPLDKKLEMVQGVMDVVKLSGQADTIIGGKNGKGGLSGGQKRRLSVAIELLRRPMIIFLDEPTSGLDARSSLDIAILMKDLAQSGRTIVTTIHQPREEIFELFDDLLVMDQGRVAFQGPPKAAIPYLNKEAEKRTDLTTINIEDGNPADLVLDTIQDASLPGHSTYGEVWIGSEEFQSHLGRCEKSAGFWSQLKFYYSRRYALFATDWKGMIAFYGQVIAIEFVVAITFSYKTSENDFFSPAYQLLMFLTVIVSYIMILQYLIIIPEYFMERKILLGEMHQKISNFRAYIIGTTFAELPRAFVQCSCLVIFGLLMVERINHDAPHAVFFFISLTLGVMSFQGLITLCSMLTDDDLKVYNILFFVVGASSLYGGMMVVKDNIIFLFKPFYYISIPALTLRSVVINDLYCCQMTFTCDELTDNLQRRCQPEIDTSEVPEGYTIEGNIGRGVLGYLQMMNEDKILILMALVFFFFASKILSVFFFQRRFKQSFGIKARSESNPSRNRTSVNASFGDYLLHADDLVVEEDDGMINGRGFQPIDIDSRAENALVFG